jgi:hypothetical protein
VTGFTYPVAVERSTPPFQFTLPRPSLAGSSTPDVLASSEPIDEQTGQLFLWLPALDNPEFFKPLVL